MTTTPEQGVSTPVSVAAQHQAPLNRPNSAFVRRTTAARSELVRLSARDLAVVELIAQLGQLPARLIGDVCFSGLKSQTPLKRTLQRLTERGLLARLELRLVGGDGGGSGQYVYQVGRQGGKLLGLIKTCPRYSSYDPHMVLAAECFVTVKRLEHAGQLVVLGYKGEDAAYTELRDVETGHTIRLTPDLWVEVGLHRPRRRLHLWLEVDRGTEHNSFQITDKLKRYVQAYRSWDAATNGAVFPRIVFVVPDGRRKQRIERDLRKQPAEMHHLFQVLTIVEFPML